MSALVLWPGQLPALLARWARRSRLVADDGVLRVERGRRAHTFALRGGSMHPDLGGSAGPVARRVVFVDGAGAAVCRVDLAEWLPGVELAFSADARGAARWLDTVSDELSERLGVRRSVTPRDGAAAVHVAAYDDRARRARVGVLLGLAVVTAAGLVAGMTPGRAWLVVVSAAAAVLLVLAGLMPLRWWPSRRGDAPWQVPAERAGGWLAAAANEPVLYLVDADARAGFVPIGAGPNAVDKAGHDPQRLRLYVQGVPVVELTRRVWGRDALAVVKKNLIRQGITVRGGKDLGVVAPDVRPEVGWTTLGGEVRGNIGAAAVFAMAGFWSAGHAPVGAAGYGLAAGLALVGAVGLAAERRRLAGVGTGADAGAENDDD